jgi:hypothetical protein
MRFHFALAFALIAGCQQSSGSQADPLGSVGGLLVDAITQQPLSGATVTVVSGGQSFTAMSGADGAFSVPKVPAGDLIVTIADSGYLTATLTTTLDGAAGDTLLTNPTATIGPIGLVKSDGTFTLVVVDEDGIPAPNVAVTARTVGAQYVDYSSGAPVGVGGMGVTATSGADGVVQLTGLPSYGALGAILDDQLDVDIAPAMVGADSYQFYGLSTSYQLDDLATVGTPTIVLAGPHTPLQVIATNLTYLEGSFPVSVTPIGATGPISIAFNQAIDASSINVSFTNDDGSPANNLPMATVHTNLLTLTPASALMMGSRYNLRLHVAAERAAHIADVTAEFDTTVPFFTAIDPAMAVSVNPTSVSKSTSGAGGIVTVTFTLNEPIGLGQGYSFPIDCVAFYEGVNLDNGDPALYPGEYLAGQPPKCDSQVLNPPTQNITVLRPIEVPPYTGFTKKFAIDINNTPPAGTNHGACEPGIPVGSCTGPVSGDIIHLLFHELPPGSTVRRIDGAALPDDSLHMLITIP